MAVRTFTSEQTVLSEIYVSLLCLKIGKNINETNNNHRYRQKIPVLEPIIKQYTRASDHCFHIAREKHRIKKIYLEHN